jgi:hypothetical protein
MGYCWRLGQYQGSLVLQGTRQSGLRGLQQRRTKLGACLSRALLQLQEVGHVTMHAAEGVQLPCGSTATGVRACKCLHDV